ncbi:phosphatase PAP2 family protein [Methanomethylovorans sp.]|uniref:phosphatase PAP2 family protein n=1 Tax=Methanomethylovorans sp. TaxID=2758717 RepID=UPI00351C2B3A
MKAIFFQLLVISVIFLMTIAGYYVFLPAGQRKQFEGIKHLNNQIMSPHVYPYLILAGFIYLLMKSQVVYSMQPKMIYFPQLAQYILLLEGSKVSYFQMVINPVLTYVSAFIYLCGFSYLLVFTFLLLILTRQFKVLQEYSIAFILIYLVAFPFYIFTPVKVTGYSLPNVVPLLYNLDPIVREGLSVVDPLLDNCFPSLHAALSVMAMLIIVLRTDFKRFKIFAVAVTLAIQFTIFYLGIHWIMDFIAGIALGCLSYYIATRYGQYIASYIPLFGSNK